MKSGTKRRLVALLLLVVGGVVAAHWYYGDRGRFTTEPTYENLQRAIDGDTLASPADPAVRMRFSDDLRYLGGQSFILYGVADTEQYFFAEIGESGALSALFWIQFEAYRPDNSYRYDYSDSAGRLNLGGYDFFVDTAAVRPDPARRRRGSDGAMVRQFLASQGLELPEEFFYARLVHLTDDSRRKELMVIYVDDLAPTGLTATDLNEGGAQAARWPDVERRYLQRIERRMHLTRPGD